MTLDYIPRDGDAIVENLRHQLRQIIAKWQPHLTRRELAQALQFDRRGHHRAHPVERRGVA